MFRVTCGASVQKLVFTLDCVREHATLKPVIAESLSGEKSV